MLQQATRPGATVEASLGGGFVGAQPAVDLAGADRQQLALDLGAEMKMLAHPGHPQRDRGLQPHRPGIARRPPDGLQHRYQLLAVGGPPSRGVIGLRLCPTGRRPVQQPQGILAVVFRVRAKLVQNLPLHFARCLAVTSVNGSQVFPYALPSHPNPPSKALCRVTLSDGLTARVTFLNGLTAPYWLHLKRLYWVRDMKVGLNRASPPSSPRTGRFWRRRPAKASRPNCSSGITSSVSSRTLAGFWACRPNRAQAARSACGRTRVW